MMMQSSTASSVLLRQSCCRPLGLRCLVNRPVRQHAAAIRLCAVHTPSAAPATPATPRCTPAWQNAAVLSSLRSSLSLSSSSTSSFRQQQQQQYSHHRRLHMCRAAGSFAPSSTESDVEQQQPTPKQTVMLDVSGMMCGGCSASVKNILLQQPGVEAAAVNLITHAAAVTVRDGDAAAVTAAAEALTKKGFPAKLRTAEVSELESDEAEAKREADARRSLINLGVAWSLVLLCCSHHFGHMLHMMGYHQFAHTPFMNLMSNPAVSGALGAFALFGPGRSLLVDGAKSLINNTPNMNSLVALGSVTSFSFGAASLVNPGLGFDASFLEEPVMLLAFVLLGRAMEARAKVRAASDLKALARLIPTEARMALDPTGAALTAATSATSSTSNGGSSGSSDSVEYAMVQTSSVRPGDILRVLPGERVPCDGEVLDGLAAVDESMLTGESVLVPKGVGAAVSGGCIVFEGPLTIKASATGAESTLAGIGRLVAAAQAREAPVQRVADAVAGKFCYGVMAASAATFTFWQTLGASLFPSALAASGSSSALLLSIKLAVDVLVVACPCALGLATPTAVLVGSSLGATRGLLMRGGDVLERIAGIDAVVLDKTGTLTEGRLRLAGLGVVPDAAAAVAAAVSEFQQQQQQQQQKGGNGAGAAAAAAGASSQPDRQLLLQLAAAVEACTRHPLASALAAEAAAQGLSIPAAVDARTEPGAGVTAQVWGQRVVVGRPDWVLSQLPSSQSGAAAAAHLQQQLVPPEASGAKLTQVYVAVGDTLLGGLGFRDVLRPDAADTVSTLQAMGLKVFLLSGDDSATVQAMAAEAGIPAADAYGSNTPQQKLEVIRRLQSQEGLKLAMVGDGVNDAPALAAADVGIALKGGLDAAGEAASVVLMGDRLSQVVDCISLGKATLAKIKQNLAWALIYNVIGIPLAAGALLPSLGIALNPSAAGGMMAFSSVAVVSNSLLLRAQYAADADARHAKLAAGAAATSTTAAAAGSS